MTAAWLPLLAIVAAVGTLLGGMIARSRSGEPAAIRPGRHRYRRLILEVHDPAATVAAIEAEAA